MSLATIDPSVLAANAPPAIPAAVTRAGKNLNDAQLHSAAKDFEAVFVTQMLQPMFAGIEVNPEFGGGHGEEMFRTMMLDEYGKQIANSGGLGLTQPIYQALLKAQEGKHENN